MVGITVNGKRLANGQGVAYTFPSEVEAAAYAAELRRAALQTQGPSKTSRPKLPGIAIVAAGANEKLNLP
jgi:hypothetical protein